MIGADPLSFFSTPAIPLEKIAKAETTKKKEGLDPGEQATIGYTMMATGLAKALPLAGTVPLAMMGTANAPRWESSSLRDVRRLSDVKPTLEAALGGKMLPTGAHGFAVPDTKRFLNIFNLRVKPLIETGGPALATRDLKLLNQIQPVVDSFLEKYDLTKKGVTMDFRRGPFTAIVRGAYYDPSAKKAVFPRVSKEIVLHELGHAADFSGRLGMAKKVVQQTLPSMLLNGLIPAAYLAGDEMKKILPGTVDDKVIEFTQRHGPALALAAISAQSLYPEAKASYLALSHIKDFEGPAAAAAAAKRLVPLFGTYVLASLPIMLGFSLAKKYFYETHEKIEKRSGVLGDMGKAISDASDSAFDAVHQLLKGFGQVVVEPGTVARVLDGMKDIATSPEFHTGMFMTGIPAAVSTYAMYKHPGGREMRDKYFRRQKRRVAAGEAPRKSLEAWKTERGFDEWREENPGLYAAYVGMGTAIGGGILNKVLSDVMAVI